MNFYEFKMDKCKLTDMPITLGTRLSKEDVGTTINSTLYQQLVGSLMYLTATRLDIAFAPSYVSRFMESPKDTHWKADKRILKYIVGTTNHGLWYTSSTHNVLRGYTNTDFASSIEEIKNTSGCVFSRQKYNFVDV